MTTRNANSTGYASCDNNRCPHGGIIAPQQARVRTLQGETFHVEGCAPSADRAGYITHLTQQEVMALRAERVSALTRRGLTLEQAREFVARMQQQGATSSAG